ncbi:class A beta-lactamase, subclass A2 [Mucilaginibacter ginsenosidivorans]|uniref:beta-lactamase n=1 Tax=Mucilaginibacter ginsenosidivorans TaxID=398053 RepID=A0A5B8UWT6_9SPHI|nr:class A beta-lactamase, subclass A2 [Mucilaginibacter ginsenosidivorans]QEC63627.1 class A beta-lactamase, subclass A2 [Mucilaginibacter ginsenosidivorans]
MPKIFSSCLLFILSFLSAARAQDKELLSRIKTISAESKGIVGVSILGLESHDTLNYNGQSRLVMHSVFKFPIAMAVLNLVDKGKYKLDKKMKVGKGDMHPNTWSPMRDKYPDGAELPLSEIIGYMVSQSDNTACDFLLKKIGGPKVVEEYIHSLGVKGIAIKASEADMASAWEVQYTNWAKPADLVYLLDIFYHGKALSKQSNDFLMQAMLATTTGPHRLRGLLPKDAVIAHKTGTSPTNAEGLSPATNDIGIITLPNGKHLAIVVMVCNSKADEATRDAVIAKIAKAAWDTYGR